MRVIFPIIACIGFTTISCGSERNYSGIWREDFCLPDESQACPETVYELHLGRYGEDVTGVVVRYRNQPGLNSFQRSFSCGCSFIQAGLSRDESVSFSTLKAHESCVSDPSGPDTVQCSTCECDDRRFVLSADDDLLVGTLYCGSSVERTVRFVQTQGRTRRQCADLKDGP